MHSVEAKSIQVRSCEKPNLINDKVCQNCGTVNDLVIANEYVDLYENRHRMRKKSISHGKYHILNIIDGIAQKNNLKIGYYNRENILRIFKLIDQVHQKLIMAENGWFPKRLFDILGIEYKFIPLTKSRKTLMYYNH